MNKKKIILHTSYLLVIITFISALCLRIYALGKDGSDYYRDFSSHFYDMKIHYENNTFPVLGARFEMSSLNDKSSPRVPGGFFYAHFLICYKLAGGNLFVARIYNLISMLIPNLIFLFWVFKKFSITIGAVISSMVLTNVYYFNTNMIFYNPNITLSLSFLFLTMFGEYTSQKNSFFPAVFIFPILALMGQAHFAVYYGIVPTVIIYLIIRYKNTKKNIAAFMLGLFLSFLTYLPYLTYEVRNNFENVRKMINMSSSPVNKLIQFPQVHSLFIFPTNEFSVAYWANNFNKIISFYINDNPYKYFSIIMLVISILFVISAFIFTSIKYFKNKEWKINYNANESKIIIDEFFLLFILYFPVTIITTILGRGVSGQLRYHYGAFALSFVPIIYFLYYIQMKNKNITQLAVTIFFILNTFAMSFNIMTYYKRYKEPYMWSYYIDTVETIAKDADMKPFTLKFGKITGDTRWFLDMGEAFNKTGLWNEVDNSNLIYHVQNSQNHTNINLPIIISNNIYIVYRENR